MVFVLSFMCKWKRNNICYQLIVIVFLTDVPKPMTTLVGRFLPVPAKLNLITQQVSYCFNKKHKIRYYCLLKVRLLKFELLRKYIYPLFYNQWLNQVSNTFIPCQALGVAE